MSQQALSNYTVYSRYAHFLPDKQRRESWSEIVDRVFGMHERRFAEELTIDEDFRKEFEFAKEFVRKKRVLGSQRALQFGGSWIEKHELKIFNCFEKSTTFVTKDGVKTFSDFSDNDETVVLTHQGAWSPAIVKNYGKGDLNKVTINRGGAEYEYLVTSNHRWILKDGKETQELKEGDYVMSAPNTFKEFDFEAAEWDEKLYWCYGFVFGDGSVVKKGDKKVGSMVRLCNGDTKYEERFTALGFKSSSPLSVGTDIFCYTGKYFKEAPNPEVDDPRLIKAFVRGYLDADGEKDNNCAKSNKFKSICSTGSKHYSFVKECFPIAGVYIVSEKNISGQVTNYGPRGDARLFRIRNTFDRDNKYSQPFRVTKIEVNVKQQEELWCLEVEGDRSFTLPNGMVTGNCSTTHINRPIVFQEIMYALLCGVGMGFSVQKHHVAKIPKVGPRSKGTKTFKPEDSIEGWADAIGVLVNSFFPKGGCWDDYAGYTVKFDLSNIRKAGALIAGQFQAPGPEGLAAALEKIQKVVELRLQDSRTLRPIDVYDIIMHASDAVLSGGVRRSATIAIFSPDDLEMLNAKTGDWFDANPQRARSNNSAALLKGDTTREEFSDLMKSTKEFGEPGFIWLENLDIVYNPCCEIAMIPELDGESGIQVCNLTEINGRYCNEKEKFYDCCRAAAIIGTLQAHYTNFKYLTPASKTICDKEALLGCSVTGIMDNPDILLNPAIQRKGAKIILETNEKIANIIGINPAARTTCVKPAGSTSCVLQTASGVHPHHARRYIRRTQANRMEFPAQLFKERNPLAVERSVWSANDTDEVISFLCEVPAGAVLKNQLDAVDFLSKIKSTQNNWVEKGTRPELSTDPSMRHNVSCTVTVRPDEWDDVEKYIFNHQKDFAGISLLASSGDLDYTQAPFSTVLTPTEIVKEYGDGSVFASGLIVDGLAAFDEDLWEACNCALGIGQVVGSNGDEPKFPTRNGYTLKQHNQKLIQYHEAKSEFDNWFAKRDWVRRCQQFADRYFERDLRRATYCLKHVSLWKTWCDLGREHVDIDWSNVVEVDQEFVAADTLGAVACSGGSCELV